MRSRRCKLCGAPPDMSYEVDSEKPTPLCGACFGKYPPDELNSRLGVTPDDVKGRAGDSSSSRP